jgi:hypothetical protein
MHGVVRVRQLRLRLCAWVELAYMTGKLRKS